MRMKPAVSLSAFLAVVLTIIGCEAPTIERQEEPVSTPISTGGSASAPLSTGGTGGQQAASSIMTGGSVSVPGTKPATTGGNALGTGGTGLGGMAGVSGNTGSNKCTASEVIRLVGNQIYDTSGTRFVARGPELVVASVDQVAAIDGIAATGANAMRMVLTLDAANEMTPAGFDKLIGRAVSHKLIVWVSLYMWDEESGHVISSALGGGKFYSLSAPAGSEPCSRQTPTACYLAVWSRQWLKDLMAKYKSNVIVDAMQEFINESGNSETQAGRDIWAKAAKTNIAFFRAQGYVQPLEIASNFQGRDLYAIIQKGAEIRSADTIKVGGDPQTMFCWQAYWFDEWYKTWQGELLTGSPNGRVSGAQAISKYVKAQAFPIQVGIDNYEGDTNTEYMDEIDQATSDGVNWLWWSWKDDDHVECPESGAVCQNYVVGSTNGFAGATRSACGI